MGKIRKLQYVRMGIDELSSIHDNATRRRKRERDKEGNFMTLAALLSMEGDSKRERW